jgi:hypothetical protein
MVVHSVLTAAGPCSPIANGFLIAMGLLGLLLFCPYAVRLAPEAPPEIAPCAAANLAIGTR